MSPWLPEKLRIGLCPGRLVIERRRWSVRRCAIEEAADPIAWLRELASTGQTSSLESNRDRSDNTDWGWLGLLGLIGLGGLAGRRRDDRHDETRNARTTVR